eukprot:CAMPEP_0171795158 /NCGR_PEP_ID=MMETSP0991-20121206/68558_1 /TAXON_ID=483369 /ORGANISM="non described non described, Strain CCMP2098" /LENGTH=66 /DNA_ID=CAMNT_0012405705 /DNA_START=850 /DNA_END=1050 /DNA_ORIENTATION=-
MSGEKDKLGKFLVGVPASPSAGDGACDGKGVRGSAVVLAFLSTSVGEHRGEYPRYGYVVGGARVRY